MNAFVFDTHHDRPPWAVPANGQSQRRFTDEPIDDFPHSSAIGSHLFDGRPIVMGRIQIVPAHFIDTYCEHRFHFWVDAFSNQTREQQFVSKEGCRMAEVEYQRMTQGNRFFEVSCISPQCFEELLITVERGMKVFAYFLALCRSIISSKNRSSGKELFGHYTQLGVFRSGLN